MDLESLEKSIKASNSSPNYITYRVLINRLCGVGSLDEAYQLLQEMKQTHWPTHLSNYQKVVEGFSKDFIWSLQLVDEMSIDDSAPLIPVYKVLIDSFQKAGRLDMALQLHPDFTSLSPSSSTHNNVCSSLMESLTASGRIDEAFKLYADSVGKGDIPEFVAVVNLVKGLLKVSIWEDAFMLSESLCRMVCCSFLLFLTSMLCTLDLFFRYHNSCYFQLISCCLLEG